MPLIRAVPRGMFPTVGDDINALPVITMDYRRGFRTKRSVRNHVIMFKYFYPHV